MTLLNSITGIILIAVVGFFLVWLSAPRFEYRMIEIEGMIKTLPKSKESYEAIKGLFADVICSNEKEQKRVLDLYNEFLIKFK